jgi:hypothetical protein
MENRYSTLPCRMLRPWRVSKYRAQAPMFEIGKTRPSRAAGPVLPVQT